MDACIFQDWIYKKEQNLLIEDLFVIGHSSENLSFKKIIFKIQGEFWLLEVDSAQQNINVELIESVKEFIPEIQEIEFFNKFIQMGIWPFSIIDNEKGLTIGIKLPIINYLIDEKVREKGKLTLYASNHRLYYEYRTTGLDGLML